MFVVCYSRCVAVYPLAENILQTSEDLCSETTDENSWLTCISEVPNLPQCLLPISRTSSWINYNQQRSTNILYRAILERYILKKKKMFGWSLPCPQRYLRFHLIHPSVHLLVGRGFRELVFWKISQWYSQKEEVINFLKPQTRTMEQQNLIQMFSLCTFASTFQAFLLF